MLTLGSQRNLSLLALEPSSGMQGDGPTNVISGKSWMKDGIFGHGVSPDSDYSDAYYSLSLYSMAGMVRQTQFLYMFCFI